MEVYLQPVLSFSTRWRWHTVPLNHINPEGGASSNHWMDPRACPETVAKRKISNPIRNQTLFLWPSSSCHNAPVTGSLHRTEAVTNDTASILKLEQKRESIQFRFSCALLVQLFSFVTQPIVIFLYTLSPHYSNPYVLLLATFGNAMQCTGTSLKARLAIK